MDFLFNWSEVHLYQSNFLQNPYFRELSQITFLAGSMWQRCNKPETETSIVFVVLCGKKKTKKNLPKRWSVKIELDEAGDISTSQVTCNHVYCAVISKHIFRSTQGKKDQNSVMHFLLCDMLYEDINETLMLKKPLVLVVPIFLHKISHSHL